MGAEKIQVSNLRTLASNETEENMNRQEKRAHIRQLKKEVRQAKAGTLSIKGGHQLVARADALRKAGVLPPLKKKPWHERAVDFLKRTLLGRPIGYSLRTR